MSNLPQKLGNEVSPDSGVRRRDGRRFMNDSGVHAKLAQAIASFGKEDWDDVDDEAVTLVRLPKTPAALVQQPAAEAVKANETPILVEAVLEEEQSVSEAAQPRVAAPGYQLALQLSSDELAKIWAHERAALGGRAFVWSEATQSWAILHDGHEVLLSAQPYVAEDIQYAPVPKRDSIAANVLQPAGWFLAGLGVAAAFLVSFNLARGAGQAASAPEVTLSDVVVSAEQHPTQQATSALAGPESKSVVSSDRNRSTDIIPVTSLPLVSDSSSRHAYDTAPIPVSALPLGAAQSVVAARSVELKSDAPVVTTRSFNPTRARQALNHASRLMHRCTGATELSGSAVVTFAPSGAVNDVTVQSITGDVSKMSCVVSAFHSVRVPAFAGGAVSVKKSFATRG